MGSAREELIALLASGGGLIGRLFRALQSGRGALARLIRNPVTFITGLVLTLIVNSVLNLGGYIVSSILLFFRTPIAGVRTVTADMLAAITAIFVQIQAAIFALTGAYRAVILSAGPAAPILAAATAALLLVASWEVIKRLPEAAWKLYQIIPGT